jgi:hypothetical protein
MEMVICHLSLARQFEIGDTNDKGPMTNDKLPYTHRIVSHRISTGLERLAEEPAEPHFIRQEQRIPMH